MNAENLGLSKKTNVAIAGVATMAMAKDVFPVVIVMAVIVLIAITYQFIIDRKK